MRRSYVGAAVLGSPAEASQYYAKIPGEFVECYVFAGNLFCFISCTARAAEGVGPYEMDVNFHALSFVSFIPNSKLRIPN